MNKPVLRPVVPPVTFTPFKGCMSIAEKLTRVIERRTGLDLWGGEDGMQSVAADLLREWGCPEKAVSLGTSERPLSPRIVAEKCGLLGKRRAKRRIRK